MRKQLNDVYLKTWSGNGKAPWRCLSIKVNEGVYLRVKLVNSAIPSNYRDGFYVIEGDDIWLDSRNPDKEVYRVKGNISIWRNPKSDFQTDKYGLISRNPAVQHNEDDSGIQPMHNGNNYPDYSDYCEDDYR